MIDILAGRCTIHGWLSDAECKAGYCLQCDEPELLGSDEDVFDTEEGFDAGEWNNP